MPRIRSALALSLLTATLALAQALTDGEVRKIDKAQGRITLKHGEIKNMDMPPMTMTFRVKDAKALDTLAVGDKVTLAGVGTGYDAVAAVVRSVSGNTFTIGNVGAGVTQTLDTEAASLRYRFDDGTWRVVAAVGQSNSYGGYQDTINGHFRTLTITNRTPVRVSFAGINNIRPQSIRVFDNTERELDLNNLDNYQLTSAASTPRVIRDGMTNGKVDLRRTLPALSRARGRRFSPHAAQGSRARDGCRFWAVAPPAGGVRRRRFPARRASARCRRAR